MKKQYYFENNYSEICQTKQYFDDFMKSRNLAEINVYKAIPEKIKGVFWCKKHSFCGDGILGICGKSSCEDYEPRNKISGVCKHHTHWLYEHGEKIMLKLPNIVKNCTNFS